MSAYDDMSEEQRRAVVEAAVGLAKDEQSFFHLRAVVVAAITPPSPLPSDEDLRRCTGRVDCWHVDGLRSVYVHALRLAARECEAKHHEGGWRLEDLTIHYQDLADEMEQRK